MRCRPFDEPIRNALQTLGFTISADGEGATITDNIAVNIIWPVDKRDDALMLSIELPDGQQFSFKMVQSAVLDIVEDVA